MDYAVRFGGAMPWRQVLARPCSIGFRSERHGMGCLRRCCVMVAGHNRRTNPRAQLVELL